MFYIVLGAAGFLLINLLDLVALKRLSLAKPALWGLGNALGICAIIGVCLSGDTLPLPAWSTWLGWGLLVASLTLLIHALFINLPFGKTYINTGVGDRLVTTGLYALVRHPWLHFYVLVLLSLLLVSHSSLLLVAAPVWLALNVPLIVIQDRYVFSRMFPGYGEYRQRTPMLWPNKKSIKAFLGQFNFSQEVTKIRGGLSR
jgi:protein-S-isoprenylcysteine O-methyltransferase Ste14